MTAAAAAAAKEEEEGMAVSATKGKHGNIMIQKKEASASSSASSTPAPAPAVIIMIDFWTAFARMQDAGVFVWPTPQSNASFISSTFGMRVRRSGNCNDFHRGVDIHGNVGDPVVASYHGIVKRVTCFSGGNKVVILEHKFDNNNNNNMLSAPVVRFHDRNITKWYTLYLHLHQQLVSEQDVVKAGDLIGTLGDSGVHAKGGPHLHHEVRLGTRCSLEYALAQHAKNSNRKGNKNNNKLLSNIVDPHVHPMYIYPRHLLGTPSITMTLKQHNVTATTATTTTTTTTTTSCCEKTQTSGRQQEILIIETTDTCPNINRYEVQIYNNNTVNNDDTISKVLRNVHVLDYNHRLGFNPKTTLELDTVDTTKPYLQPIPFGYKTTRWRMKLIIPTSWVVKTSAAAARVSGGDDDDEQQDLVVVVSVTNIWQDAPTIFKFGWNNNNSSTRSSNNNDDDDDDRGSLLRE